MCRRLVIHDLFHVNLSTSFTEEYGKEKMDTQGQLAYGDDCCSIASGPGCKSGRTIEIAERYNAKRVVQGDFQHLIETRCEDRTVEKCRSDDQSVRSPGYSPNVALPVY